MRFLLPVVLLLSAGALAARAGGEFDWSWDKSAAGKERAKGQDKPAAAQMVAKADDDGMPDESKLFDWKWGEGKAAQTSSTDRAATPKRKEEGGKPKSGGVDSGAYNELLKENLALREEQEALKKENERLAGQAKNLEQKVKQSADTANELQKDKQSLQGAEARLKAIESQAGAAEKEKQKLADQVKALQQKLAEASSQKAQPAPRRAEEPVAVQAGSDLYKDTEKENRLLKNMLVEKETDRQKALRASEEMAKKKQKAEEETKRTEQRRRELQARFEEDMSSRKRDKKAVEKLLDQIPALEKELAELKKTVAARDSALIAKEKELETANTEIRTREHRQMKAEKMDEVMRKTREEVAEANDVEKRDMHYNMAVVYAKEGRLEEAEREYLSALRMDPSDPAVHYNLGILYDDELRDKKKAAMHYRAYLKFCPHGPDVDQVKGWLMKIEMAQ